MLTETPDVFLRDFGVPCTSGGQAFTGILDTPDETLNMAGVNLLSTMYTLLIKTASVQLASLASGSSLVAGGTTFVVRDVLLQDDGLFTTLTLSK